MRRSLCNTWSEYLNVKNPDNLEELYENCRPKPETSVMKLNPKDHKVFGICPEHEKLVLAICKFCGMRIKLQSLYSHIELRHNSNLVEENNDVACVSNGNVCSDGLIDSTENKLPSISTSNTTNMKISKLKVSSGKLKRSRNKEDMKVYVCEKKINLLNRKIALLEKELSLLEKNVKSNKGACSVKKMNLSGKKISKKFTHAPNEDKVQNQFLDQYCSTGSSNIPESRLPQVEESKNLSGPLNKDTFRILSNKKQTACVSPLPSQSSLNNVQAKASSLALCRSPNIIHANLSNNIASVKYPFFEVRKKGACVEDLSPTETSCDSKTSVTVFLRRSLVMPNIKICDIKGQKNSYVNCVNGGVTLPNPNGLSDASILQQVLPENTSKQSIKNSGQKSQVYIQNNEVGDWNNLQNTPSLDLHGSLSYSWNQQSQPFNVLSHDISMSETEKINTYSYNYSDLAIKFSDLESQVIIHNVATGT